MKYLFSLLVLASSSANAQYGTTSHFAGSGINFYDGNGGPATAAKIVNSTAAKVDTRGCYIFAQEGARIRVVDSNGIINTIAGGGVDTTDNIPALQATFNISHIFTDSVNNIFISAFAQHRVRKIDHSTGIITTIIGDGSAAFSGAGGPAIDATLTNPNSVAIDQDNNTYVAHDGGICKIDAAGIMHNWISFSAPVANELCVNNTGDLFYIRNMRIYKIPYGTNSGVAIAGTGNIGNNIVNGSNALTADIQPVFLTTDNYGNVYYVDGFHGHIGMINGQTGKVYKIQESTPAHSLALDSCGNFYYYLQSYIDKLTLNSCNYLDVQEPDTHSILEIYPNPASTELTISSPERISSVRVVDVTGREVVRRAVSGERVDIDVSGLSAGVYFVAVRQAQGEVKVVRFVRE